MRACAMMVGAVVGVVCSAAGADELRWVNAAGGSWNDPGNWDLGRVPTGDDSVVLELQGAYTITVPEDRNVGVVRVRNGNVVLSGPGQLLSISGTPGGAGLFVGEPGVPASFTLSGARLYHVSGAQSIRVESGSTMTLTQGASIYTSSSDVYIRPGATLNIAGGGLNPGTTFIQGAVVVTSGSLTGEFIAMESTGRLLVVGPTSQVRSLEDWFSVAGEISVREGGRVDLASTTVGTAATISVSTGGTVWSISSELDAATQVTVSDGGGWVSSGSSEFHGPFRASGGAHVTLAGAFFSSPELDQNATVTRGWLALSQGMTVEVDGLAHPTAPLVPAYGGSSDTFIAGPLTVRVRNANALRVGDVIPIFTHQPGSTEAFDGLVAPAIGGGRVLTMTRIGSPAVTSVVVVQGEPSCYLDADFNGDGDVGTDQDIEAFFACLGGNCCGSCASADFNGDGDVGTDQDIEAYFRVLGGGSC